MNNLYVIEGTSNSGKSTTCKNLINIHNVLIIPEFMNNPKAPRPSKNLEEELINQKIFLQMEKERILSAKKEIEIGKKVFLERSYLSILAVSYALEKMGKYKAYDNALKLYDYMINSNWFIKPDMYFFLSSSYDECQERNSTRHNQLNKSWIKKEFDFYQKEFYKLISDSIENKIYIDTTGQNLEYASKVIEKTLNLRRNI